MWVFEELPKSCNDMAKIEKNQKIFSLLVFKVMNPWLLEYALLLTSSTRGKSVLRSVEVGRVCGLNCHKPM